MLARLRKWVSVRSSLRQTTLVCRKGRVWVTVSGDARDYILEAGQILTVESGHKVVVQAMSKATIGIGQKESE